MTLFNLNELDFLGCSRLLTNATLDECIGHARELYALTDAELETLRRTKLVSLGTYEDAAVELIEATTP